MINKLKKLANIRWQIAFFISLVALSVYHSSNIDLLNRVINRLNPAKHQYFDPQTSPESFERIAQISIKHLNSGDRDIFNWYHAFTLHAILDSPVDCQGNLQIAETALKNVINDEGEFTVQPHNANQIMIGPVFLEMYIKTGQKKYLVASNHLKTFLTEEYSCSETGLLPYLQREGKENYMFVDAIGMVCPFLVRFGQMSGDRKAVDLGVQQMVEFLNCSMEVETGLPFHAYDAARGEKYGLVGWTRGVGWLLWGLADSLSYLPKDHEKYEFLKDHFVAIVEGISQYSRKNGVFPWIINNPYSTIDTSGTAMIGWAVESGIQAGILSPDYSAFVESMLHGIIGYTNKTGEVMYSLAECNGVGHYPAGFTNTEFGQGATFAFYARVLHRLGYSDHSTP